VDRKAVDVLAEIDDAEEVREIEGTLSRVACVTTATVVISALVLGLIYVVARS
jgi:hypothetical protein